MQAIGSAITILFLLIFGSLWGLWVAAFGHAKCSGINPFAASALAIVLVIAIFVVFSSLDWINDWLAAKSVTKSQVNMNKQLTEQARTLGQQLLARKRLTAPPEPVGGLDYDDGDFVDYPS